MRTYIIKNNVPNPVNLVTRHPDYETIHCWLGHISDEAMRHISDNVEGAEKICFPNKKHICYDCALGKLHQHSFPENPKHSSETLGLIHSDLLSSPLCHTLSISGWLHSLMTVPPITELLSYAKNQMLQKQLKLFSGCGQILLPTLLNTCILIMGESIWHQNYNPFYVNRELSMRQVHHIYTSKMVEQNGWIRHY